MLQLEIMLAVIGASCALAAAAVTGVAYGGPQAAKALGISRLRNLCHNQRSLVFTYDDGPGQTLTPRVLDMLGSEGSHATFFLLGQRAVAAPEIVDRIAEAGHEIGCHSHDHVHAWKTWPMTALRDIRQGYETLSRWIPPDAPFRPPYGKLTLWTWIALKRRGAPIAWYAIDSGDTWAQTPDPQSIADRVARDGGGVVLLHDFDRGAEREQYVLRATALLLKTARREGLTVCRYSDLLSAPVETTADAVLSR